MTEATAQPELILVMPTYNEGALVARTVRDWLDVLNRVGVVSEILILDNGSTDGSTIDLPLPGGCCGVAVLHEPRKGHCRAVLAGYRGALTANGGTVAWVVQADADAEVPPDAFAELWRRRYDADVVLGQRMGSRSPIRGALSSCGALLLSCLWPDASPQVGDPNVPFRLMRAGWLRAALNELPRSPASPNLLLVAVARQLRSSVATVPVPFVARPTGQTSVRRLFTMGARCGWQMVLLRARGLNRKALPVHRECHADGPGV